MMEICGGQEETPDTGTVTTYEGKHGSSWLDKVGRAATAGERRDYL
jgi:hypothetical protein